MTLPVPALLMSSVPDPRPDRLLRHSDRLFALAQVLSTDAEDAAGLVAETYRRAFATPSGGQPTLHEKAWLVRLMVAVHEEQAGRHGTAPMPELRRRSTVHLIERAMPAAFSMLSQEEQLLLLLSEVERLSDVEIGAVLNLDAESAHARLGQAHRHLRGILLENMSPAERALLNEAPAHGSIRPALERLLETEVSPLPPSLKPELNALAEQTTGHASDAAPPPRASHERPARSLKQRAVRSLTTLLIIAAAGLLGYVASTQLQRPPETNVILLSAREAGHVEPSFRTASPEQAEQFVRDRLDWRLSVPDILDAPLDGVAVTEIASGVEVPAFIYREASGETIVLYAYTYALLSRFEDRLLLERDILHQIEDDTHFDLHDLGSEKVLVWRNRDDIFVAVTRGDAEALRARIQFPS